MKQVTGLAVALLVLFASGCATRGPQYMYWGNYQHTLYKVKKEPSDAAIKAHMAELQDIIDKSGEKHLRVPPGVYAELGMYYEIQGDTARAAGYYRQESETYPESQQLMARLISQLQ